MQAAVVPALQQADSYKYKPRGSKPGDDYLFGVEGAWLCAPTRHGAHNWYAQCMCMCMWWKKKQELKIMLVAGRDGA